MDTIIPEMGNSVYIFGVIGGFYKVVDVKYGLDKLKIDVPDEISEEKWFDFGSIASINTEIIILGLGRCS